MKVHDLYQSVTDTIIKELEAGAVPWTKPWRNNPSAIGVMPQNAATGHGYRGINVPLLWHAQHTHGWPTAGFMTYKQALTLGAQVRKGEKSTTIVFTKKLRIKDKETEDEKTVGMLRNYNVFNNAQIDGLEPAKPPETRPVVPFIEATKADIRYGPQPMFVPSQDFIAMPSLSDFKDEAHYHATVFHETGHWSGAKQRLDRDLEGRFGTRKYAAEELVAEFTAAFLCAHLGIRGELRHAGYIDTWLELLRHDNRAIFTAASKAQEAADYIRAFSEPEEA